MVAGERAGKSEVREFWERDACGERYGDEHDRLRYELEPEIVPFADFASAGGRRVLEIGVGMGADVVRWARSGAQVTGIDLTERAAGITRQRLADEGLAADIRVSDAENLPFGDGEFDLVYSWGVLHHTPDTPKAIREAIRVLAPGGRLKVMMYHRQSFVAGAAWIRHCLLKGRPWLGLRHAVAGIESPGTQAFTAAEARVMVEGLTDVSVRPVLTHWDRRWVPGVSTILGNRFGWFLLIEGTKPPT